jgi:hypothetical protein
MKKIMVKFFVVLIATEKDNILYLSVQSFLLFR